MKRRKSPRVAAKSGMVEPLEARVLLTRVTFGPVQSFPTGTYPDFITTADLAGNGIQDVITADYGDSEVSVLMGNGNGTFQPAVNYPVGNGPTSIAVADVNGDGKLDLVVTNSGGNGADPNPDHNTVSVLLGNGDGTFQPKYDLSVGNEPLAVAVADLNGDGIPDIVVANRFDNAVGVLLGTGGGAFGPQVEYDCGFGPEALALGDLNNDGHIDIVTANRPGSTISVLLGNGDGTFQTRTRYFVGDNPRSVAITDLNSDGFLDVITANYSSNSVTVLLGNGTGKFTSNNSSGTGGFPFSLAVADMNLDGRPDIVTADQRSNTVSVLLRGFDGLRENLDFPVGVAPTSVAVADFNGDGKPDIVTADFNQNQISVMLSTLQSSSTTLFTSQTTATLGGAVQITAVATAAGTIPKGNVQFLDGIKVIRTVPLSPTGTASFITTGLAVGVHEITAHYLGDFVNPSGTIALAGSASSTITITEVAVPPPNPLLVPILNSTTFRGLIPLGATEIAQFTINNQGGVPARGVVGVQFYVSSTQTLGPDAIPLTDLTSVHVNLGQNQSKVVTRKFFVSSSILLGTYYILAALTPISGSPLTSTDLSGVVGVSPLTYQVVQV